MASVLRFQCPEGHVIEVSVEAQDFRGSRIAKVLCEKCQKWYLLEMRPKVS